MRFRLTPRLVTYRMTFNCYKFEFSENFAGYRRFGSNNKRMKTGPLSLPPPSWII